MTERVVAIGYNTFHGNNLKVIIVTNPYAEIIKLRWIRYKQEITKGRSIVDINGNRYGKFYVSPATT